MSKVLKAGLCWLVVAALVWIVTLWRWQTADQDVSGTQIVMQLGVLPVVLTAVLLAALWSVARLREAAAKPVPLPAVRASAPASAVAASDLRQLSVAVVDAAVHLSAGGAPQSALAHIRSGQHRPGLDAQLQDVDGAPVFAARVEELDVEALRARLPEAVGDRVVRALALLQEPSDQLLARVAELSTAWSARGADESSSSRSSGDATPTMKAHLSGMAPVESLPAHQAASLPRLTVRLAVPASWSEAEREHLTAWLRMRCASLGGETQALQAQPPALHVHALDHADALWSVLDQQMVQWTRESGPQWCLVLVADSAIDADDIERRQAVGELFTAAHQSGRVPGEAATGLLLTSLDWPGLAEMDPAPVRLFRAARQRRDKSADAAGRVGPAVLQEAMSQALTVCGAPASSLALVVSDGDHRASRTTELFEALLGVAPALDPMLSVARVGDVCGDLGLAAALVPVALAVSAAQQDDSSTVTLAVNVQAPHERMAVALLPWTWTPLAAQATT